MVDEAKLKEVMAAVLGVDVSTISDDASMDSIESWNSLRQMSLVLALEEEFGVSFQMKTPRTRPRSSFSH